MTKSFKFFLCLAIFLSGICAFSQETTENQYRNLFGESEHLICAVSSDAGEFAEAWPGILKISPEPSEATFTIYDSDGNVCKKGKLSNYKLETYENGIALTIFILELDDRQGTASLQPSVWNNLNVLSLYIDDEQYHFFYF